MPSLKKMLGIPDKPQGTTVVYEVAKNIINGYLGQILPTPAFAQLKSMHPAIPDIHLAVLMYSAAETARSMPNTPGNQALDLAMRSCAAYDQGRLMVTESSLIYHLLARTE